MIDEKVDTYSFGILLWQIVTRKLPYDELIDNISFKCFCEEILRGRRPPRPDCSDEIYNLMQICWSPYPEGNYP